MGKKVYSNFGLRNVFQKSRALMSAMKSCKMNREEIVAIKKRLEHMILLCDKTLEKYDDLKQKELDD